MILLVVVVVVLLVVLWKVFRSTGRDEPVMGAVFVTGCDSGMGEVTALHLAQVGYHVFAACYMEESFEKYKGNSRITPLRVDVSNEEQVNACALKVEAEMKSLKIKGLYGVLQAAGVAYAAPFEYIPMSTFKRQMDVNFYGYIYVAKAFFPLLKKSALAPGGRRGRICFVSSGPLPGPGVPFLTSYLGAKWAGEAVIQCLRMELMMRQLPIDVCILSPGIVKPTRLPEEGQKLLDSTFKQMPPEATTEYREMVNKFRDFQGSQPGTHVSVAAQQMERIMRDGRPLLRYYVGYDAVASIVVGLLPTRLKELLIRNTLMGMYLDAPRWVW